MKIAEHVRGKIRFCYYRESNLYYQTETGIQFPVPVEDAGSATFLNEDKAILFMRWIRKHLESINMVS